MLLHCHQVSNVQQCATALINPQTKPIKFGLFRKNNLRSVFDTFSDPTWIPSSHLFLFLSDEAIDI